MYVCTILCRFSVCVLYVNRLNNVTSPLEIIYCI